MNYKKSVGGVEIYTAPTIQTIDLAVEQGIAISNGFELMISDFSDEETAW